MSNIHDFQYNTLILRELLPPPIAQCKINTVPSGITTPTLLHRSMTYCGRAFVVSIPDIFYF